ncbi:transcription factor Adf-1-like [Tribolium madens]|uniref:transcription factor Adf-1-like n=1 Tax=Tribolium madens TaxID=41895 RepID=UPI001CF74112|nr:transcription factor Adf-1-like [Tribolium madens]
MDVDEYLVSLMEKHPNLYDKRDEFYKDSKRKRESWDAIAKTMNMDVNSVKKRWENLRDRFVRVYREYTDYPSLAPTIRNKYKLFDRMIWLAPHIRKRRMTSSVFAMKSKASTSQFNLNDDTQSSETHESINIKSETQSNLSDVSYHESFLDEEVLLSSAVKQNETSQVQNKSDHYFMMSVIHDCQSLPPRKKLKFKKDVLGLLEKYLYDDEKP